MDPAGRQPPALFPSGDNTFPVFQAAPCFGQASEVGEPPAAFGHQVGSAGLATVASSSPGPTQPFSFKPLGPFSSPVNFGATAVGSFGHSEPNFKALENPDVQSSFGGSLDSSKSSRKPPPFNFSQPLSSGGEAGMPTASQSKAATMGGPSFSFTQPTSSGTSSGPFRFSRPTTSLPDTFNFSQPAAVSSSPGGFRFVQPTPSSSSASFTFSQPGALLDFSAPSKKVAGEEKTGQKPGFGVTGVSPALTYGRRSAMGATGTPATIGQAPKDGVEEEQLTPKKGVKRKDKRDRSPHYFEYSAAKEQATGSKSNQSLGKRPVKVTRPMGIFSRTLRDVLKGNCSSRKESKRDAALSESSLQEKLKLFSESSSPLEWPARVRKEETKKKVRDDFPGKSSCRRLRGESTDSLSSLPLSELTAIQCKNIPADLNKKEVIKKHFSQFGKVQRVYCQINKNLAVVHFYDHASASTAKKKGKSLRKQQIEIFWQRKKNSPGKKSSLGEMDTSKGDDEKRSIDKANLEHSPLRNPTTRSSAVGNTANRSPVKKPSSSKSLQFENECQDSPGVEDQASISERAGTLPSSLGHLIGTVAVNPEEKYRVLDQRDKLMRQARVKRTELEKAKAVVGTCPDMCPEKERYMRETRYQLSSFEIIPGTDKVNHEATIKEYSRSSADQEEPLPHELRPAAVLKITMDYLVTKIMDLGEGNYRDWYDFVWNRTRGVRKDITQQHLCNQLTVVLIEQCTRFHIHCGHHLCEEPMSSYDAKINDENLTKCLQSLKEMYQDLATKDTYCENEAEFRGYHVLLNLNEGDILREVQQFRPVIRNSPEVKLAVQAFAALNSNNFVRFFKLVGAASYLSACILHRYFKQVRREALKTLNFALTVSSQRSTMFPMETLVRMLLFKDWQEAAEFVRDYGLSLSDWYVELNRSALTDPDYALLPKKSLFIDQKRTALIGEVVSGGPLPLFTPHAPVLSFDSQGRYIGESREPSNTSQKLIPSVEGGHEAAGKVEADPATPWTTVLLEDRISAQEMLPVEQPSQPQPLPLPLPLPLPMPMPLPLPQVPAPPTALLPVAPQMPSAPPPKPQPVYSEKMIVEVVKDLVKDVVREVLRVECEELAKAGAAYAAEAISLSNVSTEELIAEVTTEILKQTSSEEIQAERQRIEDEKRRIEQARLKQERELWKSRYSQALCDELTDQVVDYSVREYATRELRLAVEEDRRARINRCSAELCSYLIKETLESEIFQAVKETLQEVHCFCKYLKKWRATAEARKCLRKQMWTFPAAPGRAGPGCKLSPQVVSPELPTDEDNLSISCIRLLQRRKESVHQMRVQNFYQQLLCEAAWTPLDLFSLVADNFPIQQGRIFWKVVLLLPSDEEYGLSDTNRTLIDWLKAKFQGSERAEDLGGDTDGVIQTHLYTAVSSSEGIDVYMHICVKVTKGPLSDTDVDAMEQRKELLGTTGLILFLPAREEGTDKDEEEVYWLSAMLQVRQLLQAKPLNPAVPLVILVPSEENPLKEEEVIEGLKLEALVAAHLVSAYIIVLIPRKNNDLQGTKRVSEAVRWLASHCPSALEICCQTLMQYIEDGLCREFSDQFYSDKSERRLAALPSQDPSPIVELYNDVLRFLSEVISSEQLYNLSWPVVEFSGPTADEILAHKEWNSNNHLAWLKKAVLSFQLPAMDLPPLDASWAKVCDTIFHYVSRVPVSQQTCPLLLSKVEQLLNRVYGRWRESCSSMLEVSVDEGPSVSDIPWDEIVAFCIDHRLREWRPPSLPCAAEAVSEDGQILVYYFQDDLKKYKRPTLWEQARSNTQMAIQEASRSLSQKQTDSSIKQRSNFKPHTVAVTSEETLPDSSVSAVDITHTYSAAELLPQRLLSGIEMERKENQRCEEQLYRWLDEGPLESLALPLYLPQTMVSAAEVVVPIHQVSAPTTPQEVADSGHSKDTGMNDSDWLNDSTMTLSDKLREFNRMIRANQEAELVCERHLSILLDITDT